MSRTYKVHTHKAPMDKRIEASSKAKKHNFRTIVKTVLSKTFDYEEFDLPPEKEFNDRKRSSGYGVAAYYNEREFIKDKINCEKYENINCGFSALSDFQKILLNEIVKRDSNFKKLPKISEMKNEQREYYIKLAYKTFTDKELEEFAHKFYMSKGGKPISL